jgi:hypothetical protein
MLGDLEMEYTCYTLKKTQSKEQYAQWMVLGVEGELVNQRVRLSSKHVNSVGPAFNTI